MSIVLTVRPSTKPLGRLQELHEHSASYATPNAFFASYELERIPHVLIPQPLVVHGTFRKGIGQVEVLHGCAYCVRTKVSERLFLRHTN